MEHRSARPSYEERLHAFKDALDRVQSGAVPLPLCSAFDLTLTLTLLDIAHAVREGRPTGSLVTRACAAFAVYAANQDLPQGPGTVRQSAVFN